MTIRTHGLSRAWLTGMALLLSLAPAAHAQTLPEPIQALTDEMMAQCRDVGGTPQLLPDYAIAATLNGDDLSDYVVNVAELYCEGAASYFCGSAGCPVSVWLSGEAGYEIAWGSYAQEVRIEGNTVIAGLHSAFCDPPTTGSDSCEERLTFDD